MLDVLSATQGTSPELGVVADVARPPRTRGGVQRRMRRGPRALFCSDSALFIPSDRSCMVATSNEGVYFLCFLYQRRFTLDF